jgi:uncharacterized membrane protein YcaP (DUF421 family)
MGKRQLGELDVGELVSTLLVSELAAIPIDDPDIPLLNAIIPTLFIISLEIIISTAKNRSGRLKRAIDGSPVYIIYKGRLIQKSLKENRISVNELLSEIRSQGYGDISEIYYGIIEQNGSLSLLKKDTGALAHTVISEGEIMKSNLALLDISEEWIKRELKKRNSKKEDIFLMTVNDSGKIQIIKKDMQ